MNMDRGPAAEQPGHPEGAKRHVAYLVNQYPKVSHTFIRREILALEELGWTIERYALRGWTEPCPDPADQREQQRTRYLLQGGGLPLLSAGLATLLRQPARALRCLGGVWRRARPSQRPWPIHLVYFLEGCLLARWLRTSGAGHVHAHFGTNGSEVALIAAELAGLPFSFTVHGPEEFDRPEALSLGAKAGAAGFVVTVSHFGRSQMMRWTPATLWPRLQVVRCGLDRSFFPAELDTPPASPQLVCVGRLCEQKGQLLLLDALAEVRRRGCAVHLILAGDGELRAELEARSATLGLQDALTITGWIGSAKVAQLIRASRALVLPSFAEGLPVVLMEALALGRPVISTYVAGIPELVIPQENGWLVPAGDIHALADSIEQVLATPVDELAQMGRQGRARAQAMHDIQTQAAVLASHFAGCLAATPRRLAKPA